MVPDRQVVECGRGPLVVDDDATGVLYVFKRAGKVYTKKTQLEYIRGFPAICSCFSHFRVFRLGFSSSLTYEIAHLHGKMHRHLAHILDASGRKAGQICIAENLAHSVDGRSRLRGESIQGRIGEDALG